MNTLMIIILLTMHPIPNSNKVGVTYEAKLGMTMMEHCKKVDQVLTEDPPKGKSAIVICVPSKEKEPASAPPRSTGDWKTET